MNEKKISNFHCESCEAQLLEKLRQATKSDEISYDHETNKLSFPSELEEDIKVILASDKVFFTDQADQDYGHDHHGHHGHHGHGHDHHHHHDVDTSSKHIGMVFGLNIIFSLAEFVFGSIFNSAAILADAVHDLGDAASVGLAWLFERKSRKHADETYSFGRRRYSLLGALITTFILISGSIMMIIKVVPRLIKPEPVDYTGMMWMSVIAIVVNAYGAWLLSRGESKNEQSLNLHMLEDLFGWMGVLAISIILKFRPWYILDPIVSMIIALFILRNAIPLAISVIKIFLEVVPEDVDLKALKDQILSVDGIVNLSHLHFWTIDGESNNFAVTIFTDKKDVRDHEKIKRDINNIIAPHNISCSTIEMVYDPKKLMARTNH